MPALVTIVALLAAVYLWWRVRYGTPPRDWPQALCYHKISSRFCWEGTWTTPGNFFSAVDRLRNAGFRFVDVDTFLEKAGAEGGAPGTLLLTFDDGYAELYDRVLPGLESRGVPVHVFLVTDYVGRNNDWDLSLGRRPHRHLGWPEIEDMARRGVTFGSHGASHCDLKAMDGAALHDELERSKAVIEARLGRPVRTVSYPFGRYNDAVKRAARAAGYEAGFSLYPPHANTTFDRFAIRRNAVYVIDPAAWVSAKITPGPVFWLEEMKCRSINAVAALTPALKGISRRVADRPPGRGS